MNFKRATDALLESITLEDLADILGASVQAVRQARAIEGSSSHRPPPQGWERAIIKLAQRRLKHYATLMERLASEKK